MSSEIHVEDIGTQFTLTILDEDGAVVDISTATTKQITFYKSDKTILVVSGSFVTDGTDGKMKYVTVAGDLSVAGTYRVQGYIVIGSAAWHSDIVTFQVYENI